MTTPEHALVGIHSAFLCGVDKRLGWAAVVLAAVASILPDADGLLILVSIQQFDAGHRVWGHNFLVIAITSLLLAATEYRFHWIERSARRCSRLLPTEARNTIAQPARSQPFFALLLTACLCQLVHLVCDMVVSGGRGLTDWEVQPWWPFSQTGYVLPLIPWGDVGPTVILIAGAIGLALLPQRTKTVSALTLLLLAGYLVIRGFMRGTLAA